MTERAAFDENDPFDAVAQMAKTAMAQAFNKTVRKAEQSKLDPADRAEALLAGALVGVYGCAMAMVRPEAHGELRAALIASLPGAFDQARDVAGLPPLGATQ